MSKWVHYFSMKCNDPRSELGTVIGFEENQKLDQVPSNPSSTERYLLTLGIFEICPINLHK